MIHNIRHKGNIIAIIIPATFRKPGIHFCTPNEFSQQMAYMNHPKKKSIPPHVHNPVLRSVSFTLEALFIKSGKLRVDLYSDEKEYLESRILTSGDVIFLASGGHGFEMLEEVEMIEIKQGPYTSDQDKTRFEGIAPKKIRIKGKHA